MVSKHTIIIKNKDPFCVRTTCTQFPKIAIFPVITTLGVPKMLHQILKAIPLIKVLFNFFPKTLEKQHLFSC